MRSYRDHKPILETGKVMKILTFSTLYPDSVRQRHGVFVETRLRQLLDSGEVQSVVLAPVPWFPLQLRVFGGYAALARIPGEEKRNGIKVIHPRYPLIPRFGMSLAPFLMALSVIKNARDLITSGYDFDLIDAHYFYPDGVAAVLIANRLKKPVYITARGSDVNILAKYRIPRLLIQFAARYATGIITVSSALKLKLVELGVPEEKISVLRNGVDLKLFRPGSREAAQSNLGLNGKILLSVGNLIKLKGHDLIISALAEIPDATLVIVGDGPELSSLSELSVSLGVSSRVRFVPAQSQVSLSEYYCAADVLILASSNEGWPNVLLEAMACGTPVVATCVGGIPEIVQVPEAGRLIEERSPQAIVQAVRSLLQSPPDRNMTRRFAEQFDWNETTKGQLTLFRQALIFHQQNDFKK